MYTSVLYGGWPLIRERQSFDYTIFVEIVFCGDKVYSPLCHMSSI